MRDEKFSRLFLGNIAGYPSRSEADSALCWKLTYWTGRHAQQIDRLFRQSRLMREKWDERHGEKTYGAMTIEKAIAACTEIYTPDADDFRLAPVGELLSEPDEERPWVVRDLMPSRGTVLIVSKPKVGKTTAMRQLVFSVARGVPFLGFETTQGPVAYISFDDKRSECKAHFQKLGVTQHDPIETYIGRSPKDAIAKIRRAAERSHFVMIVVDNLQKLVRVKDASAYAEVTLAMEEIEAIARETGAVLVLTYHSPKRNASEDVTDAAIGSTAFTGAVDNIFHMQRHGAVRTIRSVQRIGKDLEEHVVTYDATTGEVSKGRTRREMEHRALQAKIIDWRTGTGKRGQPYRYSLQPPILNTLNPNRRGTGAAA
jgi:hypothetical protein